MPKMTEEDLKNSLQFEAEKYIPFNVNEVIIDASILGQLPEEENQVRVLLAAAKKRTRASLLMMMQKKAYHLRPPQQRPMKPSASTLLWL